MKRSRLDRLLPTTTRLPAEQAAIEVTAVEHDSRHVRPGALFVAVEGLTVDGHDFAAAAARAGAVAIVAGRPLDLAPAPPIPCIVVADPVRTLGEAAARLHGRPSDHLKLIGITGTNGKTTTTYLLESILTAAGHHPGVVGTISYRFAGEETVAPFTTPTAPQLQRLLGEMARSGCDHAALEVSSHALQLGRLWGCEFAVTAFSQLSQDHLDLHGDMQRYLAAKLLLFRQHLRRGGAAVVNVDGNGSAEVVETVRGIGGARLIRCSSRDTVDADGHAAEVRLSDITCDLNGVRATLSLEAATVTVQSPLIGRFNADNMLLAAGCADALGLSSMSIAEGMARLNGVPGRLERIDSGTGPAVLVDYAHTPDALSNALAALRPLCDGRLLAVFGCGGDRDQHKRPLMGRAVAHGADLAIVTSDNPRSEPAEQIIQQILPGLRSAGAREITQDRAALAGNKVYLVEPDRRRAINAAVAGAGPGDVVLIAGKGHEAYQIIGSRSLAFDDRQCAREALALRQ